MVQCGLVCLWSRKTITVCSGEGISWTPECSVRLGRRVVDSDGIKEIIIVITIIIIIIKIIIIKNIASGEWTEYNEKESDEDTQLVEEVCTKEAWLCERRENKRDQRQSGRRESGGRSSEY